MRRERFHGWIRVTDFEFGGDCAGACQVNIGHRNQAGMRNRAAEVLGMAPPHFAYSDNTYV
jgi:hypothetical protein